MQADNRAILAGGAYPLNVVTAVTLQTSSGVEGVECLRAEVVAQQVRRLLEDYPVKAIKVGMLGSAGIARAVADVLEAYAAVPCVLDPVLVSSSGAALMDDAGVAVIRERLMPRAQLTTPNLDELYRLAGVSETLPPLAVALRLAETCGQSVLLKGGHLGGDCCEDWLLGPDGAREKFSGPRIESTNLRGTGCALSALIAAECDGGLDWSEAVSNAKRRLQASMQRMAKRPWHGNGPSFL